MARNVNVAWVYPTTRQSGLPLPANELAGVELSVSVDNTNWTVYDSFTAAETSTVVPELEAGTWYFRGVVLDTAGRRSAPLVANIIVPDESPPGPLSTLNVTLV